MVQLSYKFLNRRNYGLIIEFRTEKQWYVFYLLLKFRGYFVKLLHLFGGVLLKFIQMGVAVNRLYTFGTWHTQIGISAGDALMVEYDHITPNSWCSMLVTSV